MGRFPVSCRFVPSIPFPFLFGSIWPLALAFGSEPMILASPSNPSICRQTDGRTDSALFIIAAARRARWAKTLTSPFCCTSLLLSSPLLAAPSTAFALLLAGFLTRRPLKQSLLLLLPSPPYSKSPHPNNRPTDRAPSLPPPPVATDRQRDEGERARCHFPPVPSFTARRRPSHPSPLPSLVGRSDHGADASVRPSVRPSIRLSDPDAQERARDRAGVPRTSLPIQVMAPPSYAAEEDAASGVATTLPLSLPLSSSPLFFLSSFLSPQSESFSPLLLFLLSASRTTD